MNRPLSSEPARALYACHICQERCDCDRCKVQRAAPDLLAFAVLVSNGMVDLDVLRVEARAAIRKAKGE